MLGNQFACFIFLPNTNLTHSFFSLLQSINEIRKQKLSVFVFFLLTLSLCPTFSRYRFAVRTSFTVGLYAPLAFFISISHFLPPQDLLRCLETVLHFLSPLKKNFYFNVARTASVAYIDVRCWMKGLGHPPLFNSYFLPIFLHLFHCTARLRACKWDCLFSFFESLLIIHAKPESKENVGNSILRKTYSFHVFSFFQITVLVITIDERHFPVSDGNENHSHGVWRHSSNSFVIDQLKCDCQAMGWEKTSGRTGCSWE